MRQIALDTESTGLKHEEGHRLTEIGCVELINRKITGNEFQCYINPEREIEDICVEITGLTNDFLRDKPVFSEVIDDFINFIGDGAELIIHNAAFDLGFLDAEFSKVNKSFEKLILNKCTVIDTLQIARNKYPGQRNSLDALCSRLDVTNFDREKHGALLDSKILVEVYLRLTGGQSKLFNDDKNSTKLKDSKSNHFIHNDFAKKVVNVTKEEDKSHEDFLAFIEESNNIKTLWNSLEDK